MSMMKLSGYQAYQRNKYETASPHKLILLLYDGALTNIHHARDALYRKDRTNAHNHMLKAQDILYELMSCLNEEQGGDIARNLKNIYLYCIQQLTQANLRKTPEQLDEVEHLISQLRSAWAEIGKDVGLGARN